MPSKPAYLSSGVQLPPMPLYVNQGSGSVRGDTEQTVPFPEVGASVPGERPRHEHEEVLGRVRSGAGFELIPGDPRGDALAAHVVGEVRGGRGAHDAGGREVDAQDAAPPSRRPGRSSRPPLLEHQRVPGAHLDALRASFDVAAQVALEEHRSLSGRLAPDRAIGRAGTPRRRTRSRRTRSRRCTGCRCRDRCTALCRRGGRRHSTRRSCTGAQIVAGNEKPKSSATMWMRERCALQAPSWVAEQTSSQILQALHNVFLCTTTLDASLFGVRHLHTSNSSLEASPQLHDGAQHTGMDGKRKRLLSVALMW